MKLIDANVFLYAVGRQHEYGEPCRSVLSQILTGRIAAATDSEVLQEIMYVYRRQQRVADAVEVTRRAGLLARHILSVDGRIIFAACDLLDAYRHIDTRDAIHAAVVLENDLEGIISTDRGFDSIPSVTRFDPKGLAAQA
jgi:predicted nucleic acid-binding protein